MIRSFLSFTTIAVLLTACTDIGATQPPVLPEPAADTCAALNYGGLIGRDGTTLERVLIMRQVRVLRPDSMMTMDYRPERINFEIGETGLIDRIFCG